MSWIAFGSRLDIFASRWDPGCLHLRASYEGLGLEGQDKPLSTRHEQAQRVALIFLTPPRVCVNMCVLMQLSLDLGAS